MSYYNPRIYNYSNLHREDKVTVHIMMWTLDTIENMETNYEPQPRASIMEKMFSETAQEVISEIEERVLDEIIEFIVSTIDGYDHEVKLILQIFFSAWKVIEVMMKKIYENDQL